MPRRSATSQCGRRSQVPRRRPARRRPISPASGWTRGRSSPQVRTVDVRLGVADRDVRVGRVRDPQEQLLQLGLDVGRARRRSRRSARPRVDRGGAQGRDLRRRRARRRRGSPRRPASRRRSARPCRRVALAEERPAARVEARARRRRASASSPLSSAPLRMRSGSSRSRWSPTLMPSLRRSRRPPRPAPDRAGRLPPRSRATTKSGARLARSQPARGPFVRPRKAR